MSMSAVAESITHLDLDSAIKSNQLAAVFEPYVSLRKLQARGVELHLVWQHPQYGRLSPGLFMPFIAAEGRSRQVTGFMLREAARAAADWRRAGLDWTVSLNLPLEDLADNTLPSTLGVLLDEFDLPAEVFIIDIGEADLLARGAKALPALTGLRALGCGVALDSAPGEAMIQDLRGLPFTEIKVSGAAIVQFIDRTLHSGQGRVAARVYNARSNGMPVTAIGVDSEPMLWSVQRLELDAAQGPYICTPSDALGLVRWEKIWREAAENIRNRKVAQRRPLKSEAPLRPQPQPQPQPAARPAPPPVIEEPVAAAAPEEDWLQPLADEPAMDEAEAFAAAPEAPFEPIFVEEERIDVEEPVEAPESLDEPAVAPPAFLLDETAAEEPSYEEPAEDVPAPPVAEAPPAMPAPRIAAAKPAPAAAPAPAEEGPVLIARKLPGISKPIVMTVQNQGSERFKFLKRLGRKG